MNVIKSSFLPAVCLAGLLFPPAGAAQELELVDGGKSSYSISLRSDASPSEQRAAAELRRFIEEMSGARLPIVTGEAGSGDLVIVGANSSAALGPESFSLKTVGRNLVIAGGRERGTMYGVYTLLERLGCRWFTPTVSRIPKMPTIRIPPLDETQTPDFEYREPYFWEAFDRDWAARNKTNGHFSRLDASTGGKGAVPPLRPHLRRHPSAGEVLRGPPRVTSRSSPASAARNEASSASRILR